MSLSTRHHRQSAHPQEWLLQMHAHGTVKLQGGLAGDCAAPGMLCTSPCAQSPLAQSSRLPVALPTNSAHSLHIRQLQKRSTASQASVARQAFRACLIVTTAHIVGNAAPCQRSK